MTSGGLTISQPTGVSGKPGQTADNLLGASHMTGVSEGTRHWRSILRQGTVKGDHLSYKRECSEGRAVVSMAEGTSVTWVRKDNPGAKTV